MHYPAPRQSGSSGTHRRSSRPVGRLPIEAQRYYASFSYQARSWKTPRRVVAKVEWHPGELYPRAGFIVADLPRPTERVVGFYSQRGSSEEWIKEGKNAAKWTRLSCCPFTANTVRLQRHALAYNLANFLRTLALPDCFEKWSLTGLRGKLVKICARLVVHGRWHDLPNGGGRRVATTVPGHPVAHRHATRTACGSVRGQG